VYQRNFASRLGRHYAKPLWLSLRSESKSHGDLGALIMLKIRPVITKFQIKLICSCCAPKQKLMFTPRSLFVRYENTSVLNGKGRIMNHDVRSNQRERERERERRPKRTRVRDTKNTFSSNVQTFVQDNTVVLHWIQMMGKNMCWKYLFICYGETDRTRRMRSSPFTSVVQRNLNPFLSFFPRQWSRGKIFYGETIHM
jgi:hypothetical protein